MFIEIKNQGEMDLNALVLIGASTKRGDPTKIGYFGSGLKYAMAVLIRYGVMPRIYIGNRLVDIQVNKREFRGHTFSQIMIDGEATSLTAEMGIDWEAWFAIRELYCNAVDEGECTLKIVDSETPQAGTTSIYIDNTANIFDELLLNWDKYFSEKRHDVMLTGKIDEHPNGFKAFFGGDEYVIYRRGVRCYHSKQKCLYHYDISRLDINEARTIRQSYDATWEPCRWLAVHADREAIKNVFDNWRDTIESHFPWESLCEYLSPTWLEVLGGRRMVVDLYAGNYLKEISQGNCVVLPSTLCHAIKKRWPKESHIVGMSDNYGNFLVVEKTPRQQSYIDNAIAFLFECGITVDQPVEVALFEDKSLLGAAVGGKILLSIECMEKGKREVVSTMFEEYIHIKHEVADCSRAMQQILFDKIITLYEEKTKVFL